MRFLHTSDWHLGRPIRGISRQPEFEEALERVAEIAEQEKVDALLISGDIFDTFSPPAEAEQLLYETLRRLVMNGIGIVSIAGNHDNAQHMDALSGLFKLAGIQSVGTLPSSSSGTTIEVASRDRKETAVIAALPWVLERQALSMENLAQGIEKALLTYSTGVESLMRAASQAFRHDTANLLMGHMLIDGAAPQEKDSGERKIHMGIAFAVQRAAIPETAQYVALGHVHRPQRIETAAPAYYSGSLLQLDFGEAGQAKMVNLVEVSAGVPAVVQQIPLAVGRGLRTITLELEELAPGLASDDEYLRVFVKAPGHVPSLAEKVRDALPNAVDIRLVVEGGPDDTETVDHQALSPDELFRAFYLQRRGIEASEETMKAFHDLLVEELAVASD